MEMDPLLIGYLQKHAMETIRIRQYLQAWSNSSDKQFDDEVWLDLFDDSKLQEDKM